MTARAARLHDALQVLLQGVVRVRGRMWVATQPDEALAVEAAGGGLRIAQAVGHFHADSCVPTEHADADDETERRG